MRYDRQEVVSRIVEETLQTWIDNALQENRDAQKRFLEALGAMGASGAFVGKLSAVEWLAQKYAFAGEKPAALAALEGLFLMCAETPDHTAFFPVVCHGLQAHSNRIVVRAAALAIVLIRSGGDSTTLGPILKQKWAAIAAGDSLMMVEELGAAPMDAGRLRHFLNGPTDDHLPAIAAALTLSAIAACQSMRRETHLLTPLLEGVTHPCWLVGQTAAEALVEHGLADAIETSLKDALNASEIVVQLGAVAALGRLSAARHKADAHLAALLRSSDFRIRAQAATCIGQTLGACDTSLYIEALQSLIQSDPLIAPIATFALQRQHIPWKATFSLTQALLDAIFPLHHTATYAPRRLQAEAMAAPSGTAERTAVVVLLEPNNTNAQAHRQLQEALRNFAGRTAAAYTCFATPSHLALVCMDVPGTNGKAASAAFECLEWLGQHARDALFRTNAAVHRGRICLRQRYGMWELHGEGWNTVQALHSMGESGSILVTRAVDKDLPGTHPHSLMLHAQGYYRLPNQVQTAISTYWNPRTGVGNSVPPSAFRPLGPPLLLRSVRLPKLRYLLGVSAVIGICLAPAQALQLAQNAPQWALKEIEIITRAMNLSNTKTIAGANSLKQGEKAHTDKPGTPNPPPAPPRTKPEKGVKYLAPEITISYREDVLEPGEKPDGDNLDTENDPYQAPKPTIHLYVRILEGSRMPSGILLNSEGPNSEDTLVDPDKVHNESGEGKGQGYVLQGREFHIDLQVQRPCFAITIDYLDEKGRKISFPSQKRFYKMHPLKAEEAAPPQNEAAPQNEPPPSS